MLRDCFFWRFLFQPKHSQLGFLVRPPKAHLLQFIVGRELASPQPVGSFYLQLFAFDTENLATCIWPEFCFHSEFWNDRQKEQTSLDFLFTTCLLMTHTHSRAFFWSWYGNVWFMCVCICIFICVRWPGVDRRSLTLNLEFTIKLVSSGIPISVSPALSSQESYLRAQQYTWALGIWTQPSLQLLPLPPPLFF